MIYILKHNIPIIGTILFGLVCAHLRIFEKKVMKVLADYIFFVALPCMLLFQFSQESLDQTFNLNFVCVFIFTGLILGALAIQVFRHYFSQRLAEQGIAFMTTAQINASYLGIPIFVVFFKTVSPIAMVLMAQTLVMTPIALGMIEYDVHRSKAQNSGTGALRGLFLKEFPRILLRTPIIIVSLLGVSMAVFKWQFPSLLVQGFKLVGNTTAPVSLFLLGLSLYIDKISFRKGQFRQEVVTLLALKNFVHPALAFILGKYVFQLQPFWLMAVCLISTMPSPRNASLFAQRFHLDVQRANTLMVLTTFITFVVVNSLLYVFGNLPDFSPFFHQG